MTKEVPELLKRRVEKAKGKSGQPIGSVRKAHDAAVEKAGIKDHFKLYDLRHTFATRSVGLPTLSAILGHTSIQMTMRYVHPAEEQKRFAAGKLETFRRAGFWKPWKRVARPLQFPLQCSESDENERPQLVENLVGAPGFEPGASCAQGRRATRLRYAPTKTAL